MQSFDLISQLPYEDTEKTAYYYKAKHERWVRVCQANEQAVWEVLSKILKFILFGLKIALYGLIYALIGVCWVFIKVELFIWDLVEFYARRLSRRLSRRGTANR